VIKGFLTLIFCVFLIGCGSSIAHRYSWEDSVERSNRHLTEMERKLEKLDSQYDEEFKRYIVELKLEGNAFWVLQAERLKRGEITQAEHDFLLIQKKNELISRLDGLWSKQG